MSDLNRITLSGRLGTAPVLRTTKTGTPVVHFSVATSRRLSDGPAAPTEDGKEPPKREETQWHKVVVWGKQAQACAQYLDKGRRVFLEGSMRTRKYEGKDGQQRLSFEVHAERVNFLDGATPRKADFVEVTGGVAEAAPEATFDAAPAEEVAAA